MKTVTSYSLLLALLLFAHCAKSPADPALYFLQDASLHFYFSHPEPDADSVEKEKARNALVNALDAARATVRVWCYEMDEPAVIDALVRAKARGVSMDIKGSPDVGYGEAEARGLVIARRPKSGLAHAKVVIIDQSKVFSGSGNLTTSDFFWNNNAFFLLNVGDSEADQIRVALDNEETTIPPILPFQGRMLVSPGDGRLIQMRIVRAILLARVRIQYLIFSHTDPVITAALAFQAMRGVLVEGIYDDAGETSSLVPGTEAHQLNNALGVLPSAVFLEGNRSRTEVKPGEFHGGHLHHKTMIIDDRLVVTGSYNWSLSARDQNREAYFEFADPAVAQLFVREFSRIKESALPAGRPPFIDRAAPRMTLQTGGVCWDNAPAQQGFTIFSGKGTFLRADHYNTQSAAVSGCVLPASKNSASAGVQWGSSYGILPAADSGELSAWQFNLTSRSPVLETEPGAGRSGSQTALWQPPCDADPCSAAPLFRTHLPDGWIWLRSESERYTEAVFWTPDGFETRALSRTATNFYRFQPFGRTVGDTIVFLKTESGRYEAGCTRTGTTLSGPPRTWLKAYAFEAGRSLSCVEDES